MKNLSYALLCTAILISCGQKKNFDPQTLEKEAQTVAHNFIDNLSKNDTSAIMATFSKRNDFTVIMNNTMSGREEFHATASQMIPSIEKQTFENMKEKFVILSPETFVYCYTSLNKMFEKNGVVTTINPILSTYTFHKEADGWKILHMHETWLNMAVDSSMVKK